MMDEKRIAKLRALIAAATEGPWVADQCYCADCGGWAAAGPHHAVAPGELDSGAYDCARHDAALIAASRTALPEALDEIERLRAPVAPTDPLVIACPHCSGTLQFHFRATTPTQVHYGIKWTEAPREPSDLDKLRAAVDAVLSADVRGPGSHDDWQEAVADALDELRRVRHG